MVCRAPIATATIANVRKGTSPVEDTVTVEVTVRFKVFETLKLFSGKKYCYGGMEGEYCHCDYCRCKHGYGLSKVHRGQCVF